MLNHTIINYKIYHLHPEGIFFDAAELLRQVIRDPDEY